MVRFCANHAFAAALLLMPACGAAGGPPPPSAPSPLLTKDAPSFERRDLTGTKVGTKTSKGNVVVVKFFAKYCEPCKKTLPAVQHLTKRLAGVSWIGVSEDEYASDAQTLVDAYGLTFPVVHDQGNVLAGRFRVAEMPVTFVIDGQGVVQWVGGPDQTERDLERAIRAQLEG